MGEMEKDSMHKDSIHVVYGMAINSTIKILIWRPALIRRANI